MPVAAAAVAAAGSVVAVVLAVAAVAVDDEDGIQCRRRGGHSMVVTVFDSSGDGMRICDVEAKMAIDTRGGAGGDDGLRHLMAAMDEGGHCCLMVVMDGSCGSGGQ